MSSDIGRRLAGRGLVLTGLDSFLLRRSAVVVMFHRVQDTDGSDPLTVDAATFERHCRFFRRHFNVVGLRAIVRALEARQPVDHMLAITFDDGYRDNCEVAARVLERLSLPATFFVVTQWIGTDVVPWWDQERGAHYPWMTWDDVQTLHGKGFEIGAHTRTHADLGCVSGADARQEILGARRELEARLGAPVESFAYPYGKPHHLTETNRELVREAGFRCCCSGFGGVVAATADPFRLQRVPISSWYASPHQFAFDVALGRSVLSS